MRRVLSLFSPSWLLRHVLALGLVAFFVFMGRWQWFKGESSHGTLQNLFYGIEWWIFTAFVLYLWGKMIAEQLRPGTAEAVPGAQDPALIEAPSAAKPAREPAPVPLDEAMAAAVAGTAVARPDAPLVLASIAAPASLRSTPSDDEDPEDADLAAYNDYLATLRGRDRR